MDSHLADAQYNVQVYNQYSRLQKKYKIDYV